MSTRIDGWRRRFGMAAHPEGGFFVETFRAAMIVETPHGPRNASTAILYALPTGGHSAWHRVAHDEVWHWHGGGDLLLHTLSEQGHRVVRLGAVAEGAEPSAVVPAGVWQAAEAVVDVLVGCTVAPGFDFADFEMADGDALAAEFPAHAHVAGRLARGAEEEG